MKLVAYRGHGQHHSHELWMWVPILLFVLMCLLLVAATWHHVPAPIVEQWPSFPLPPVPFTP